MAVPRIVVLLLACLAGAGPASAVAVNDLAAGLRRCAGLDGAAERLSCFDELARSAEEAAAAEPAETGRWRIAENAGALAATQAPIEPWGETGIVLELRCAGGRLDIAVSREAPIMSGASVFVTVRVDDRLVPSDLWTAGPDYRSAHYPGDKAAFLNALPAGGRLFIRLEGSRRWRFEGTYQLDGLEEVRRRLTAACPR